MDLITVFLVYTSDMLDTQCQGIFKEQKRADQYSNLFKHMDCYWVECEKVTIEQYEKLFKLMSINDGCVTRKTDIDRVLGKAGI